MAVVEACGFSHNPSLPTPWSLFAAYLPLRRGLIVGLRFDTACWQPRVQRSGGQEQSPPLPNQGFLTPVFGAGPFSRTARLFSWQSATPLQHLCILPVRLRSIQTEVEIAASRSWSDVFQRRPRSVPRSVDKSPCVQYQR